MTVAATAPSIIKSLRDQLAACASWTSNGGSAATIYYPRVDPSNVSTYPIAVLAKSAGTSYKAFTGVTLPYHSLTIEIWDEYDGASVDTIETLAYDLQTQLCQTTGLEGLRVTDVSMAEVTNEENDTQLATITIQLETGLEVSS